MACKSIVLVMFVPNMCIWKHSGEILENWPMHGNIKSSFFRSTIKTDASVWLSLKLGSIFMFQFWTNIKSISVQCQPCLKGLGFWNVVPRQTQETGIYTVYESQSQFLVPNALKVLYLFWAHFLPNKNPFSTCHSNSAMLKLILPK